MEHKNQNLRILGFDIGSKRIGLALWDPGAQMARPLPVLQRSLLKKELRQIEQIVRDNKIEMLVVGVPIALSGAETRSTQNARFWMKQLKESFAHLKVETVDESLSTGRALRNLKHIGPEKRAEIKDSISACMILEDFLREGALPEDH